MKKFLAMLLSIIMMLSLMPAAAFAGGIEEEKVTEIAAIEDTAEDVEAIEEPSDMAVEDKKAELQEQTEAEVFEAEAADEDMAVEEKTETEAETEEAVLMALPEPDAAPSASFVDYGGTMSTPSGTAQSYILQLMHEDRIILIRGNHEDLFQELVEADRGMAYQHHISNGTYDTAFLNIDLCMLFTEHRVHRYTPGKLVDVKVNSSPDDAFGELKVLAPMGAAYFETDGITMKGTKVLEALDPEAAAPYLMTSRFDRGMFGDSIQYITNYMCK